MRTITTEENNETNMAKIITSKNTLGLVSSATREEALIMLEAKKDMKEAATVD